MVDGLIDSIGVDFTWGMPVNWYSLTYPNSKDKEIDYLKGTLGFNEKAAKDEVEQLEAKVAMLGNAIELAEITQGYDKIMIALNATEADVQRYINGIKANALEEVAVWFNEYEEQEFIKYGDILVKAKQLRGEV